MNLSPNGNALLGETLNHVTHSASCVLEQEYQMSFPYGLMLVRCKRSPSTHAHLLVPKLKGKPHTVDVYFWCSAMNSISNISRHLQLVNDMWLQWSKAVQKRGNWMEMVIYKTTHTNSLISLKLENQIFSSYSYLDLCFRWMLGR